MLFSAAVAFFALLLVDGYGLDLLGRQVSPALILVLLVLEAALGAFWISRQRLRLESDPLELAGFLFAVVGTWLYVVFPSWPTLVPPTYSGDAANHLMYIDTIFSSGRIFGDYPGGPALVVATVAHWIGWLPLRLEHPLAALWLALIAGGVYILACAILPERRIHRATSLLAVFALYIPSLYFVGMLVGPQYFMTQVAAQLFLVAFLLFLVLYLRMPIPVWPLGMALCLFSITVSFPLWLALPLAVFGSVMFLEWRQGRMLLKDGLTVASWVLGLPVVFWVLIVLTGGYYISNPGRLSAQGAVIPPTWEGLGGWFLVLPALGMLLLRRLGSHARAVLAFFAFALLQTFALLVGVRLLGWNEYWANKSFYVWLYPIALFAVIPFAWAVERVQESLQRWRLWPELGFLATGVVLSAGIIFFFPPPVFTPLTESEIQVALWTKGHLDTVHVNYIGAQNLTALWLSRIWHETLPSDLLVSFPALGPKTFGEWRDDPNLGEYLFIASDQHFPTDPGLQVVYRWGDSEIIRKTSAAQAANGTRTLGRFGNTLALVDYAIPSRTLNAGDVISLTAHIETLRVPARQVAWRLQLRDLANNIVAEERSSVFGDKYPLQRWPDGIILRQRMALPLPADVQPGLYDLQLGLYAVSDGQPHSFTASDGTQDDIIHLSRVKVALPRLTAQELAGVTPTDVKLGNAIELLGYRILTPAPVHTGDSLKLVLYWQCLAPVAQEYTAFVHLLDPNGSLRAQIDSRPRAGTYPTSIWEPNEIIPDPYSLTIPPDAAPGSYHLEIGMYQWPSLARLPVTGGTSGSPADHLILETKVDVVAK